ncbi:hypothetical protein [Cutibacterium granulosum]|nr:hypothetical protein [Cutibacterium granulosum]
METRTGISPAVLNSELGWLDEQDSPVQEDLGDTALDGYLSGPAN